MHDAALDEHGFAGSDVDIPAVNPPGRLAGQSVNGLIPALMIMRDGHARIRLPRHLEHVETAGRLVLVVEKPELEGTKIDGFSHDALLSRLAAAPPSGQTVTSHKNQLNLAPLCF